MRCFEFMEGVSEGFVVRYPYLFLGEPQHEQRLLLWGRDQIWLYNNFEGGVRPGERFLFTQADLRMTRQGLRLTSSERESDQALVLVRTTAGEGGRVLLRPNSAMRSVLSAADSVGAPETLFVAKPGGLLRIQRTGELEDAPPEFILGWDGRKLHELHKHVRR